MANESQASSQTVFARPFPDAVTYDLSQADEALISLPPGSSWTSGSHWHDAHTEYLQVLSGSAEVVLSGTVLPAVGSEDGIITVPRGAIHRWRRSQSKGLSEELVVKEWTDPRDGQKALFFRFLNRRILEAIEAGPKSWQMRTLDLTLMNIFWRLDNSPAYLPPSWPGWLQGLATKSTLTVAAALGYLLGCQGVDR